MLVLSQGGVQVVHHYAPLHYLPFIARSKKLKSKPTLLAEGFGSTHFRSMSCRSDTSRGFGDCTFLTIDPTPRILAAKLAAGFPHIGVRVPSDQVEAREYSLCRYNVAMTRKLRREGKIGFTPCSTNGRYYGDKQIPIARTIKDKKSMLEHHLPKGTMIEIMIEGDLDLDNRTRIICFSAADYTLVSAILCAVHSSWEVRLETPPGQYPEVAEHREAVQHFVERALAEENWKGSGLEFDRLKKVIK